MVLREPHLKAILQRHFGSFTSALQVESAVKEILKLSSDWTEVSLKDIPAHPPFQSDCLEQCELARLFFSRDRYMMFKHQSS